MRLLWAVGLLFLASAVAGWAQDRSALVERYYAALKMDDVFEVLRLEGLEAGEDITEDGEVQPSNSWTRRLEAIYSIEKMEATFYTGLIESGGLDGSLEAIEFFEGALGRRIIQIELDARIALHDEDIEADVRGWVEAMRKADDDRLDLYDEFIAVNDLIDGNVMGALNSNLAFYQGMASNPNFDTGMPQAFMLSTVWEQEPEIRESVTDWSMNFSTLAYSVLSVEEMQEYIEISASEAGQRFNTALFGGFDYMFEQQSYELGQATAEFMMGDET
ncbi:MAG: hypothetical protein AAGA12_09725 [Pseudomonadota bacterium]